MILFISFHSEHMPGINEDCPKPYMLHNMLKRLNSQIISCDEFYNLLGRIRFQVDEIDDQFLDNSKTAINIEFHPEKEEHLIEFSFSYYIGTIIAKQIN